MEYVEKDCVFRFHGREFEAGGAVITPKYLIAYPAENGILNDWHGKKIGRWRVLSSQKAIFFGHPSWIADRYYYMRAIVDGAVYSLRGFGIGMIAKGKRIKKGYWD